MRKDKYLVELLGERPGPVRDACNHCGATRFESLHSNYKGCRLCRQSGLGSGPIGALDLPEEEQREYNRQWLESKEKHWPGGFAGFCKQFNLNEAAYREDCK